MINIFMALFSTLQAAALPVRPESPPSRVRGTQVECAPPIATRVDPEETRRNANRPTPEIIADSIRRANEAHPQTSCKRSDPK